MNMIPPPATQNSARSRVWRESLLTQAVTKLLKKQPPDLKDSAGSIPARGGAGGTHKDEEDGKKNESKDMARSGSNTTSYDEGSTTEIKTSPINPMESAGEGGVQFTTLTWWQGGMCMVAETISLGILTLPKAISNLGLVAGTIVMLSMGLMATYTGYIIGQYKLRHPDVHSMGDAGSKLFGKWGKRVCGNGALGFLVFIMGSHILTFRVMMDVLTEDRFCGVAWTALGFGLSFIFCLPRTMKKMSYLSAASFLSILGAVTITMVAVIIQHPGAHIFQNHLQFDVRAWPKPGLEFHNYFESICNIAFAYAGHVAFFSFISELKDPRDFNKALAFLQVSDISMYVTTAVVIYLFAGENVKAPALNSASPLFSKISYGVAVVTIIIAGVVNGHIVAKQTYVRYLKDRPHVMGEKTWRARGIWYAINAIFWAAAWLLAEIIPLFTNLVGLSGALFASWFTYGVPAMYWLHMHLGDYNQWLVLKKRNGWSWRKWALVGLNYFFVLSALVICVVGIYASIRSMMTSAKEVGRPFSCKHPQS